MRALAILALVLPTQAAAFDLEACLEAGGLDACYGRIVDACIEDLPPPAEDAPLFQWKDNDRMCWAKEHAAWDGLLNRSYRELREAVARLDPAAPDALKAAQRAWITLRDADCAWPETFLRGNNAHHHSVSCATRKTAERASWLRAEALQWKDW